MFCAKHKVNKLQYHDTFSSSSLNLSSNFCSKFFSIFELASNTDDLTYILNPKIDAPNIKNSPKYPNADAVISYSFRKKDKKHITIPDNIPNIAVLYCISSF